MSAHKAGSKGQERKASKQRDIQGRLELDTMETTSRIRLMVDMPWQKSMLSAFFLTKITEGDTCLFQSTPNSHIDDKFNLRKARGEFLKVFTF